MASKYRWHWYMDFTVKRIAEQNASRIRRRSAHRSDPKFKVRVRKVNTKKFVGTTHYYVVEWYGKATAL